uniref:Methyltransferase FkbM domain-containing protein n=1 Tax=Guillardia theta TaxID=55529 RepID=A0A7S4KJL2_GUITH
MVAEMESMLVVRTNTPYPFWFALPTSEANPGYLSNSARDTRVMNPSGSVIMHALLEAQCRVMKGGRAPLVVDVGAHVGWFTMMAASYGCRVLAIEPQPHAHVFLNASLLLNGWKGRIDVVHAAVGDKGGSVKMVNRHGWDNWDVTEMTDVDDDAPGDVVRQVRLDDLVDDDILLLKIDAEGAEDLVMRSALRILEGRKIDSILLEAKGSSDEARNEFKKGVFKGLVEKGYTAYEFYEEVGRSVFSWNLHDHLFPLQVRRGGKTLSFENWPSEQVFEDHLFVRQDLDLPKPGTVSILFPPMDHVFRDPSKIALVFALYNYTSTDGSLNISINKRSLVEKIVPGSGNHVGRDVEYFTLLLPELPEAHHFITVRALDMQGEELLENVGSEDTVHFTVNPRGASMSSAIAWHCSRFLDESHCR